MNEIKDQIQKEAKSAENLCSQVLEKDLQDLVRRILRSPRIFVTGAGRSGLMAKAFAMRLAQMGRQVHVVGDETTPRMDERDLLLVCSISGRTQGPLLWARIASELGASVIALTCRKDSPLGDLAHHIVLFPEPEDKGPVLASTMELALLLILDGISRALLDQLGLTENDLLNRHANLE